MIRMDCKWVNVSSGTGLPRQRAVKWLSVLLNTLYKNKQLQQMNNKETLNDKIQLI